MIEQKTYKEIKWWEQDPIANLVFRQTFKLNGKSVKIVILRNCIISHIGMEILAKKEACGILQLIRDLHFIGKLRKRASNKYNRDWEQKILNADNEIQISCSPFHGRQGFSKECVKRFLQHWRGPLKWWAFYCFCGKENGGDKRDNLNWQMAFLNREKVISQIFEVGQSANEPV